VYSLPFKRLICGLTQSVRSQIWHHRAWQRVQRGRLQKNGKQIILLRTRSIVQLWIYMLPTPNQFINQCFKNMARSNCWSTIVLLTKRLNNIRFNSGINAAVILILVLSALPASFPNNRQIIDFIVRIAPTLWLYWVSSQRDQLYDSEYICCQQ